MDNPVPVKGKIERDSRGYIICHICGRGYRRLGSHVKESHNMTIAEYKEKFGLCSNAKTTEKMYSEHMKNLAYRNNMPARLLTTGMKTRIQSGQRKRLGKKARLQESLDKREKRFKIL